MTEAERRMLVLSCQTYAAPTERAALRCALGDAAALCDLIAREMEDAHRSKRGRYITKSGQLLAAPPASEPTP